ncbi:Fic family protein [Robertmurraya andreesenii]|uniref:Prophage maintenance system killer protein n=1 Tax=Anoxybacillus andreesenii TaxID=1325932 RepID=A0ABT9V8W4_9BACL|nr:Fic family protein [Robertmurraya andreesenii]MDQ0157403.1 prophage maintenance system killer protein [Robertmurraya andreesenii]
MNIKNKYSLSDRESRFLLKKSIVALVHSASRLENVNTTFPQTKTIVEGMSVSGVPMDDIQVILNLKNAYQYVWKLPQTSEFNLELACKINSFISYNESLEWGVLRTGNVGIHGVDYTPAVPVESEIRAAIEEIRNCNMSETYKALKYMYFAMRAQLFWDGNKRTAIVSANTIMMLNGTGIININEKQLEHWNSLLSEFYESNLDDKIIQWTYENCIHGIDY